MQRVINMAAGWTAAWVVVVCLLQGCATGPTRETHTTPTVMVTAGTLDPATKRLAESLAHYAAGVSREITGGPEAAINDYQQAAALAPGNPDVAIRVANVLMSRRRFAEAATVLEKVARTNPRVADVWFWLGIADKAQDKLTNAVTVLNRAVQLEPTNLNAIQVLLDIHLRQNALPAVIALLEHAHRQKSVAAGYWMRLGDLYALTLKEKSELEKQIPADRVLQCYEKAQRFAPDDPEVLQRLAAYYENAQDPQKALTYYSQLAKSHPDNLEVQIKVASLDLQAGNKERAIREFEQVLKLDPLRFPVYNLLGELYQDAGNDDRAQDNLQQSLVINPNQIEPRLSLAFIALKKQNPAAALRILAEAEGKFPTDYRIPYVRGIVDSEKHDYADALTAYADAETMAGQTGEKAKLDANFFFRYGGACERTGELDRAEKFFRKAIELDPQNHLAYNYLGYMWADKGIHLNEAYDFIKKALALDPDNAAYLDSLGWVLFKMGRTEEALLPLRRAVELLKEPDATVFGHLADVLSKLGQKEEALSYLKRAAQLDPTNKELAEKLKSLAASPAPATQ